MKSFNYKPVLLLCIIFIMLLSGCNTDAGYPLYSIIYPSGNVVDFNYATKKQHPLENTDYLISHEKDDKNKTKLNISTTDNTVLFSYEDMYSVFRGFSEDNGKTAWLCSELWKTSLMRGYVDSKLGESNILQVDLITGEVLFKKTTGKNEFFITASNGRCYFYECGKEATEKLWGLWKTPATNAQIFCRTIDDWDNKVVLHTFDFVVCPPATEPYTTQKIYFYPTTQSITTTYINYTQVSKGVWEDIPSLSVEILFSEN